MWGSAIEKRGVSFLLVKCNSERPHILEMWSTVVRGPLPVDVLISRLRFPTSARVLFPGITDIG
jgi:hypothetical protein